MSFEAFLAFFYGKKSGNHPNRRNTASDFGCAFHGKPRQLINIEKCSAASRPYDS